MIEALKILKEYIIKRQKDLDIGQAGICLSLSWLYMDQRIDIYDYIQITEKLKAKSNGKRYEGDGSECHDHYMFWFPNFEARIKAIDELIKELEHEQQTTAEKLA